MKIHMIMYTCAGFFLVIALLLLTVPELLGYREQHVCFTKIPGGHLPVDCSLVYGTPDWVPPLNNSFLNIS